MDDRDKKTAEKYYKGGSTIELKCIVRQIVGEPPEYILWHHEDRMLNYDTERGGIRYLFSLFSCHFRSLDPRSPYSVAKMHLISNFIAA